MMRLVPAADGIAALLLTLALTSCAPAMVRSSAPPSAVTVERLSYDRLYFGRAIPGGGMVSDEEWSGFLREVVTPLFPSGLTTWNAVGQWRDRDSGQTVQEESFVLELVHPAGSRPEPAVNEVIRQYRTRFRQQSVMRIQDELRVSF